MKATSATDQLLTNEDRDAWVHHVMHGRFTNNSELFLPTSISYDKLDSSEGLQDFFVMICRWLGIRSPSASARFGKINSTYSFNKDGIVIAHQYRNHPLAAGALTAIAATGFALQKASKSLPSDATVERATITLGLGLVVLNGLRPKLGLLERIYHAVDGRWFKVEGIGLQTFSNLQYSNALQDFIHEARIQPEQFLPHTYKDVKHYFNENLLGTISTSLPMPLSVVNHRKSVRLFIIKIIIMSFIAIGIIGTVILAMSKNNSNTPPDAALIDTITSKHAQLVDCLDDASQMQNNYDTTDLFNARMIEAKKSECQSINNEYRYLIRDYKTVL